MASEFGTQEHARALQKVKRDNEIALAETERVSRVALDAAMKHEQNRQAVTQAIFDVSRKGWAPKLGLASDVEQILAHHDMKLEAKRLMHYGLDVRDVVTSAWAARQDGITLQAWFRAQHFDHPDQVHTLRDLLKRGWLV